MVAPLSTNEVDGVPVLIARTTGPMRAGLVFRVGRVDETLAAGGISHLVEHLALHRNETPHEHYNGMTSATTTQFVVQGTDETIIAFFNDVCASLRDLPVERLAIEKKLLETEAANRPAPINLSMPLWRHGARDFGLVSYPEWGTQSITDEQVAEWARTRFNRANAVLWIAGDQIPRNLRLDLPDGQRWHLPVASSALPVVPAYFTADKPALVLDGHVPRSRPAVVFARALDRALFRELRQNRGLSYTVGATYSVDGRPKAVVTAIADARAEQLGDTVDCFLTQLHRLATSAIDDSELRTICGLELTSLKDPDVDARLLPRRATDLLAGYASPSTSELIDGFQSITPAQVTATAQTFVDTALLMLPNGYAHRASGFEPAPAFSRFAVAGHRHRSHTGHDLTLIQGDEGISFIAPQGTQTVLFTECAAMLRWPDGARHLLGTDGISIRIEPALFRTLGTDLEHIDSLVPASAIIDMPARDPNEIPTPTRSGRLRRRVRAWLLPRRARFDRLASTRGGARQLILSAIYAAAAVASIVMAFTIGLRFLFATAIVSWVIAKRRKHGYW